MTSIQARHLTTADHIYCPRDGSVEKVLFNRPAARGRRFVRTSQHDHYLDQHAMVTRATAEHIAAYRARKDARSALDRDFARAAFTAAEREGRRS